MKIKLDQLDTYFAVDPASGKGRLRKIRARQAIIGIGVDYLSRIFVIYAWAGKLTSSKFRDKILDVYGKFEPRRMGIEANAMQSLFADLVRDKGRERFSRLRIVPIMQSTKVDKDFRIRTSIEPTMFSGRLFIQGKPDVEGSPVGTTPMMRELVGEIAGFPTAETKDMVDALASAISLVPKRTSEQRRDSEVDELAQYLRRSGASPHMIEKRVEELRLEKGITVH